MNGAGWAVVGALAAGALARSPGGPGTAGRRVRAATATRSRGAGDRPGGAGQRVARDAGVAPGARRVGSAVLAGSGLVVVLGPGAAVLGLGAALVVWWVLGRLEPAAARRRRDQVVRDLPAAADLLLACVEAGASPHEALRVVGGSAEGPLADALRRAGTATALGASTAEAVVDWRADRALRPLLPLGAVLARSESDGSSVARALGQLAADLRVERAHRGSAAARRAGVHAAAPLGLCFLPAFVLVGLVPLVLLLVG